MLTIISPAAHQRLTTVEALRLELGLTGGADDAYLQALIEQASAAIASWCGRSFALESVRETLHRYGRAGTLMVSRWPVVSIDAVTIGNTVFDPALTKAEDGGFLYQIDAANSCRVGWPSGKIVVDYAAGFVLPGDAPRTLPADIERAALILARAAYFNRARDPMIRSEEVVGVASTSYGFGGADRGFSLPPEIEGLLSRHRAVSVI